MVAPAPQAFNAALNLANHLHRHKNFVLCAAKELRYSRIGSAPFASFTQYVRIDQKHG
jgi:hypothetical protein